jgi:hypothetical protein
MHDNIFIIGMLIILYFLPFIISNSRKHKNQTSIFFTNLFFGWTVLGWLVCFIWAFSSNKNN